MIFCISRAGSAKKAIKESQLAGPASPSTGEKFISLRSKMPGIAFFWRQDDGVGHLETTWRNTCGFFTMSCAGKLEVITFPIQQHIENCVPLDSTFNGSGKRVYLRCSVAQLGMILQVIAIAYRVLRHLSKTFALYLKLIIASPSTPKSP